MIWNTISHLTEHLDLSLSTFGLGLLDYFLNESKPIPVAFIPLLSEGV